MRMDSHAVHNVNTLDLAPSRVISAKVMYNVFWSRSELSSQITRARRVNAPYLFPFSLFYYYTTRWRSLKAEHGRWGVCIYKITLYNLFYITRNGIGETRFVLLGHLYRCPLRCLFNNRIYQSLDVIRILITIRFPLLCNF